VPTIINEENLSGFGIAKTHHISLLARYIIIPIEGQGQQRMAAVGYV